MSAFHVTWEQNVSLGGGTLTNGVNVRKCQYEIFEGALRECRKIGVTNEGMGRSKSTFVCDNKDALWFH